ncbi:sigma factor-like helix-turn-helix DNA-binding protein [Mycobacteroides abscessus]|nr:sigma factor-like helix-turn-helix DNA-binding protein [Mycobacteroides abscessus]
MGEDTAHSRRGTPWTGEELHQLVRRVRDGVKLGEIARAHGRTTGAINAALWRLLPAERRPDSKSRALQLLRSELAATTAPDVDWWARYVQGRAEVRADRTIDDTPLTAQQEQQAVSYAEHPLPGWEQLGDEADLGPLIVQVVDEITDTRQRFILSRRLGLFEGSTTLAAIGDVLGITRERVRQLQNKAIDAVQRDAVRRGSAGETLSVLIECLTAEHSTTSALAETLLAATQDLFRGDPVFLVMLVASMSGHSTRAAGEIAAAAAEHRVIQRRQHRDLARRQAHIAGSDHLVDKWVRDADWPNPTDPAEPATGYVQRRRMPTGDVASFQSEKTGAVVYCESSLEEAVFMIAETSTRVRTYQEQPCEIAYTGEDGMSHTYYPDLLVTLTDGRVLLVEVKPLWQMALTINRIKYRAGQHYAAKRGWGWVSVAARGHTYRDLGRRNLDPSVCACLAHAIEGGPISWRAMQELRIRTPITTMDVATFVLQENAGLQLNPYRLYSLTANAAQRTC